MGDSQDHVKGWIVAGLLVGTAVAVAAMEWVLVNVTTPEPQWDLAVYRGAIQTWADGGDLYSFVLDHPARESGFPFTYPPFAALVLYPLIWVPTVVADNLWTLFSLSITTAMAAVLVWRAPRTPRTWLGIDPPRWRLVAWTAGATIALMITFPGVHNIVLGQVSFLITGMMLVDIGGLTGRRWQGALTGLASAIKLTPLIAVPYFAVTRQFRQAGVALGVFAAATVLAIAVNPTGSITYWTDRLFDTSHVGDPATVQNKSILGVLSRWDIGGGAQTALWLAACVVVVAFALWQARRQFQAGQLVGAALIVGCASVAASPVSWPHHQSWIILVAVWLLLQRSLPAMLGGGLILLLFMVGSPFMGQEVVASITDAPTLIAVGREVLAIPFVAVCLFGLPRRSLPVPEEVVAR